jgi:NodT family efflux transporter outer membrane factor (OMF) lipoprotein
MTMGICFRVLAVTATAVVAAGCAGIGTLNSGSSDAKAAADPTPPDLPARYSAADNPPGAEPIAPTWWEGFGDPALTRVVAQALRRNADLEIAAARIAQAQAVLSGSRSALGPRVDLNAGAQRSRSSSADPNRVGAPEGVDRNNTTYRAGSSLAWEWDAFGRNAQLQAAAEQRLMSRQAALAATQLAVASQSAQAVIEIRSLQQQQRLAEERLSINTEAADLAALRLNAGLELPALALRTQAAVQSSRAELAQLATAQIDARRALAVLAGVAPQQVDEWLSAATAPALQVPAVPTVGLPSDLLQRRADVLEAQANLRAASADLASAAAERYPRLSLTASLGWVAATVAGLGTGNALAASIAPTIDWTIWDGGAARARIDQQTGQQREALARWQQAVQQAFAEADTALTALERRRAEVQALEEALRVQQDVVAVTQSQRRGGLVEHTAMLDSRRAAAAAQTELLLAQQQQLLASVALYRALGGHWDTESRP